MDYICTAFDVYISSRFPSRVLTDRLRNAADHLRLMPWLPSTWVMMTMVLSSLINFYLLHISVLPGDIENGV